MRITADTNILLRAILEDDPGQAEQARAVLQQAEAIAVPIPVFCELSWSMRRLYRRSPDEIASAIAAIVESSAVVTDRPAVEAGLRLLRAGGDFADGAIAWQGAAMGADTMISFDRGAVRLLNSTGLAAAEPSPLLNR